LADGQIPGPDTASCVKQLSAACDKPWSEAYTLYLARGNDTVKEAQLAGFMLTRGPFGFMGHGWEGNCNADYSLPAVFLKDCKSGQLKPAKHNIARLVPCCAHSTFMALPIMLLLLQMESRLTIAPALII